MNAMSSNGGQLDRACSQHLEEEIVRLERLLNNLQRKKALYLRMLEWWASTPAFRDPAGRQFELDRACSRHLEEEVVRLDRLINKVQRKKELYPRMLEWRGGTPAYRDPVGRQVQQLVVPAVRLQQPSVDLLRRQMSRMSTTRRSTVSSRPPSLASGQQRQLNPRATSGMYYPSINKGRQQ